MDRIQEALEAWLAAAEAGRAPDPEAWLARYPDLADDLRPCLRALSVVQETTAPGRVTPAPPEPKEGQTLGDYQLLRPLGRGGMGAVHLALALAPRPAAKTGDLVAVKVLHPHLLERRGFFQRFLREAQLGRQVRHENVVRTLDVDAVKTADDTVHFLVMEYVEGTTLRELLHEMGRVPEGLVREIGRQAAAGLAAIHAAGIVHRDLKPENVLITPDHRVRIMDLGIARPLDDSYALTRGDEFAGSLPYAAPEQFGGGDVGHAADLYALGVLLFELTTGTNPFRRDHAPAVMQAHLEHVPARAGDLTREVTPFLSLVLATLLEKDPARRFESAERLREVLQHGEEATWWTHRERDTLRAAQSRPTIPVHRETTLHGREDDLAVLRRAWDLVRQGHGRSVLLEGEAGIGKTRLIDAFVDEVSAEEVLVLYGSYPPTGGMGGLSDAVTQHFGEADLEAALRPHLAETPSLLEPFVELMRHEVSGAGAGALAGDALHALFVQLMRSLASKKSVVWVVDDLHFAEASSRKVVLSMARALAREKVLLVLASRPGLPEEELVHFGRVPTFERHALGRLGAREVMELLRDAFHSEALADRLGGKIAYKSDGVPFFVFEMIRGLHEQRLLEIGPDGTLVDTGTLEALEVPSAVRDLIAARLEGLEDEERNLLDVASVQGHEFDPHLLGRVWGLAPIVVLSRLAALERRSGLVRPAGRLYRFDHHQIQEVLYDDLGAAQREAYHLALAQAHQAESHPASEGHAVPGETAVFLAGHLLRGGRPAEGKPYLEVALTHLARGFRIEAALDLLDQALASPGLLEGEERVRTLVRRSSWLGQLSRPREECTVAGEALALAASMESDVLCAEVLLRRGVCRQRSGHLHEAAVDLEGAIAYARTAGADGVETDATRNLGTVFLARGKDDDARRTTERSLEIARDRSDVDAEAAATINLGNVFQGAGRFAEATACYERGIEMARSCGNRAWEANALAGLGNTCGRQGQMLRMQELNEQFRDLALEMGDRHAQALAAGNLAIVAHMDGRYADARTGYERCAALAVETGDRMSEASSRYNLGMVLLSLGCASEARDVLERARALAAEIGMQQLLPHVHLGLALVEEQGGDIGGGLALAEVALASSREAGRPDAVAEALVHVGRLRYALDDEAGARDALMEARTLARDVGVPGPDVLASCLLANLPGGDASEAAAVVAEKGGFVDRDQRMAALHLLWQATGEVAHLDEAGEILAHLLEHVPEAERPRMLEAVALHRAIHEARSGAS